MHKLAMGVGLLLAAAPAAAQVEVGRASWDALPRLRAVERPMPTSLMVTAVEDMLRSGQCEIPGQSAEAFDFDVPFAVLVEPDGQSQRVVVAEMNCPQLESLVGLVVLGLARQGDFQATGRDRAAWYGSRINFNLQ